MHDVKTRKISNNKSGGSKNRNHSKGNYNKRKRDEQKRCNNNKMLNSCKFKTYTLIGWNMKKIYICNKGNYNAPIKFRTYTENARKMINLRCQIVEEHC